MKLLRPCVLLVDNDSAVRALLSSSLKDMGCKTITAGDGAEALHVLHNRPYIDVIVTEVELPVMSGLDFLRILRRIDKFKRLPVIFVSASVDETSVRTAVEFRCGRYLLKPVQPEFLLDQISSLLRRKPSREDTVLAQI